MAIRVPTAGARGAAWEAMRPHLVLLSSLALGGCGGARVSTTTVTSASQPDSVTPELAVQSIADAHCARELSCGNVGAALMWGTLDGCTSDVRRVTGAVFADADCPRIDGRAMSECIVAIRDRACTVPSDSVATLGACRRSPLCQSVTTRGP